MDDVVVHGGGADGPLQRVLALASTRAVIVPPAPGSADSGDGAAAHQALRACLEGSHHLRVAVVGQVPVAYRGERRVVALTRPETRRGAGLPTEWNDWLDRGRNEMPPLLDRPWRVVRLLS
jgi:hypothetical protein